MFKFLILFAITVSAIADPLRKILLKDNTRIYGGHNTSIEFVPYQVSFLQNGWHFCGGAIISEHLVLTAASCMVSSNDKIRAGSTFINKNGSLHTIVNVITHQDYQITANGIPVNDIALVEVLEPFFFDKNRQPVPLGYEPVKPGSAGLVAGWGETETGEYPNYLLSVSVLTYPKNECDDSYYVLGGLPEGQICAGYPNGEEDACSGDAGSPLVVNDQVVGIVSWGFGCGLPNYPGVYTDVSAYGSWLFQNLYNTSDCTLHPQKNNSHFGRIFGGQNADIKDFPYQVSFLSNGVHRCGGSIISDQWILTNAICDINEELQVRSGSTFNDKYGSLHAIIKTIKHEDFKFTDKNIPLNDIALVKVDHPFKFDETRQPIPLFNVDEQVAPGSVGKIVGWGLTEEGKFSEGLMSVSIPVSSKEKCNDIYGVIGGIQEDQICAGEKGKDFCIGDSGSALVVNGKAAGIVSWTINCGQSNFPGVYTNVAAHRSWIDKKLQTN